MVEAETAFIEIKTKLRNAALLAFPAPDEETAIFVDASETGCGESYNKRLKVTRNICPFSRSHSTQLRLDMLHFIANYLQFT